MNQRERNILFHLSLLIDRIPAGHSGMGRQTRSLAGINKAHDDFVEMRSAVRMTVTALVETSLKLEDADDARKIVECFDAWIENRRAHNWEFPVPCFYTMWTRRDE